MLNASRRDQAIDRPSLNPLGSTVLPKPGRLHIGLSLQREKREGFEEFFETVEILAAPQAVEQFLKNIPDQEQSVARFDMCTECADQRLRFVHAGPPEDKRPNRRVNDDVHAPACRLYDPNLA